MGEDRGFAKHGKTKRSGAAVKRNKAEKAKSGLHRHSFWPLKQNSHQEHARTDYQDYQFSWKERLRMVMEYLVLSGGLRICFIGHGWYLLFYGDFIRFTEDGKNSR